MRNFIRVTQHGYARSEEVTTRTGRRECLVRCEYFFEDDDRQAIEEALHAARKLRDSLPGSTMGTPLRGRPRLVAYRPVPGHPLPLVGVDPVEGPVDVAAE